MDHASREIRHGRLSREQGLALVRRHECVPPRYLDRFCEWLGMQPEALRFLLDQHRNPAYWHQPSPGTWTFQGWSSLQAETPAELPLQDLGFRATATRELDAGDRYITIGKGWPC